MKPHVHLVGWQKIPWALDEDLRWARTALEDDVVFTSLPQSRIVLAAWWPALKAIGRQAFLGKTVVCFADNPPAFYLTQTEFSEVAERVDLWIARSREAVLQFDALGLAVARAPYCVDPHVFKPLAAPDAIRADLGIPAGAFVIGNFHRDTEGCDLTRPKAQKGADIFLEIARALHRQIPETVVLLAGPRRHWLLGQLENAGIPHVFAGQRPGVEDDYERNILDRPALNRLYQALDVCVVSSRWEGGPYSILEALLAGRPVVSTPVGIARDLLSGEVLFREPAEAVSLLAAHADARTFDEKARAARQRALEQNSSTELRVALRQNICGLPGGGMGLSKSLRSAMHWAFARVRPPVWRSKCSSVEAVAARMGTANAQSCFFESEQSDPAALAASACGIRAITQDVNRS